MHNLQRAADRLGRAELAIDLSNIIGKLPSRGYLILSGLPDGARLSNGHDNGDTTWTLMFDELSNLKFLPGAVRGIVSLKAEIFSRAGNGPRPSHTKRQVPLILHTDDGVLWTPPDQSPDAGAAQTPAAGPKVDRTAHAIAGLSVRQNATDAPKSILAARRDVAETAILTERPEQGGGDLKAAKEDPTAARSRMRIAPPAESRAVQPIPTTEAAVARGGAAGMTRFLSKTEQRWSVEVERLFSEAVTQLRSEAEEALSAAEQRRVAELKELSAAIMKQHETIAMLKKEAEQSKEEAATRLAEAENRWKTAEADRMNLARQEWSRQKDNLTREAEGQRSRADELTGTIAALKAESERERQAFDLRTREAAAEAERSLQSAREEWQREVARCLDTASLQIRAVFKKGTPAKK